MITPEIEKLGNEFDDFIKQMNRKIVVSPKGNLTSLLASHLFDDFASKLENSSLLELEQDPSVALGVSFEKTSNKIWTIYESFTDDTNPNRRNIKWRLERIIEAATSVDELIVMIFLLTSKRISRE